jgi:hypothetical protein
VFYHTICSIICVPEKNEKENMFTFSLLEARRRTENNTIQLQETITDLFNQTDAATENIPVAMEMQSDSVLNLNSTEEISSSSVINLNFLVHSHRVWHHISHSII